MKRFIFMAMFLSLTILGCDDGENLYDNEVVVGMDCSDGDMNVGMSFDSNTVHCGKSGNLYFGIEWMDPNEGVYHLERGMNPVDLYLYSNGDEDVVVDSVWTLETDSVKISTCEKLDFSNSGIKGTFCLNKFEKSLEKDYVSYYDEGDKSQIKFGHYVVYSKFNSYNALCVVESYKCVLLYSCLIRYDGTYNFSSIPSLDGVKRKNIWCIDL